MPIVVRLDQMLKGLRINQKELAVKIGIAPINLSHIKTGKIRSIRFSTLDGLCRELGCKPGDLLDYQPDEESG